MMKLNRKVMTGAAVVLGIGAASIAGVSAVNAATGPEQASKTISSGVGSKATNPDRETTHHASVSVGTDGKQVVSGDVDPTMVELPPLSAETQAAVDAASAKYPGGAMISIGKDGKVTASPLTGTSGSYTATAPAK